MCLHQEVKVMIHRDNHKCCLSLLKVLSLLQILPCMHHACFSHRLRHHTERSTHLCNPREKQALLPVALAKPLATL